MRHKYTGVLTAVLMLTSVGCIDDRFDDSSQGRVPISLTATAVCHGADSAAAARTTRTTSTALQSAQLDNGQTFYAHFPSGTTSLTSTTFTADGSGGTTATVIPYFTLSGTSTDVRAYYPSSVTNTTTTFSVLADQSTDANYRSSDLMFASANITKASPTGALSFAHKMAKVKIGVTTNDVTVTKVQLRGIKRRVPFTPSTGAVGSAEVITGETVVTAFTGSTTTDFTCTALVPAQSFSSGATFVAVTTAGNIRTYTLPSAITLAAGNEYTYNLIVKYMPTWGSWSNNTSSVDIGSTFTRTIPLYGINNTPLAVTYSSSNTGVATVNSSGVVTGVSAGTATITASYAGSTNYDVPTSQTYTVTVNSSGLSPAGLNLGDIIYDDGTVTANNAYNSSKHAIGVVVYKASSAEAACEAGIVSTHGTVVGRVLVMSLQDVSSTQQWFTANNTAHDNTLFPNVNNTLATAQSDFKGYAKTKQMATKTGECASHTHAAATAAWGYTPSNATSTAYLTGSTGWFLPSIGQWMKVFQAMAGAAGVSTTVPNAASWSGAGAAATKLSTYITNAGGNASTLVGSNGYWSSSESGATYVQDVYWSTGSSNGFHWGGYYKSYAVSVRPFLAY